MYITSSHQSSISPFPLRRPARCLLGGVRGALAGVTLKSRAKAAYPNPHRSEFVRASPAVDYRLHNVCVGVKSWSHAHSQQKSFIVVGASLPSQFRRQPRLRQPQPWLRQHRLFRPLFPLYVCSQSHVPTTPGGLSFWSGLFDSSQSLSYFAPTSFHGDCVSSSVAFVFVVSAYVQYEGSTFATVATYGTSTESGSHITAHQSPKLAVLLSSFKVSN